MAVTLPDDQKAEVLASIRAYFRDERGEEIGELQAAFLLDFVLKEIGPSIYNQALRDAQARLQGAVADLVDTLYEEELAYSAARRARRNARG